MNWRDTKRQARQTVHATMAIPFWRVSLDGSVTPVRARLHRARVNQTNAYVGDLESLGFAETANITPRLIFDRDEVEPVRGDRYVAATDEGYEVETTLPSDDRMVTADCSRMDPSQMLTLPALTWPVVFP